MTDNDNELSKIVFIFRFSLDKNKIKNMTNEKDQAEALPFLHATHSKWQHLSSWISPKNTY